MTKEEISAVRSLGPIEEMAAPYHIVVEPMAPQLLVQKAGEDWTGVTSTAERRKLQNRLNKRSQCKLYDVQ